MTIVGILVIAVAGVIMGSSSVLSLIAYYLAWVNPEKLHKFCKTIFSKWPGYELARNIDFDTPLTKSQLWAIRIGFGLPLLGLIGMLLVMIRL